MKKAKITKRAERPVLFDSCGNINGAALLSAGFSKADLTRLVLKVSDADSVKKDDALQPPPLTIEYLEYLIGIFSRAASRSEGSEYVWNETIARYLAAARSVVK